MKYQEQLFAVAEGDRLAFLPNALGADARNFLEQFPDLVGNQLKLIDELNLSGEDQELLDRLYRGNHILAGMAQLHGVEKIDRLLGLLDFAFDLARSVKTLKRHSIDYLVALFYQKSVDLAGELLRQGKIETEISDLIDETRNYLLEPLREWNRRIEEAQNAFHHMPPPEEASSFVEAPAADADSVASTPPPARLPAPSAVDIPFEDEPEPLNIPLDKLGMISDFYEENTEILNHFGNLLLELENASDTIGLVNDLFRMIHTVKGGARLLKILKLECLAHTMENLLDLIRQKQISVRSDIIDLLLDCKGALSEMMEEVASRGPLRTRIGPHVKRLQSVIGGSETVTDPPPAEAVEASVAAPPTPKKESPAGPSTAARPEKAAAGTESLRVSSEKLDEVLNTASEIFIGRIRFQNEITAIQNFIKSFKLTLDRASDFQRNRIMTRLELYIPEFSKELKHLIETTRYRGRALESQLPTLFSNIVNRLLPDNSALEMSLQEELNLNYLTIEEIQKQLQKNLETLERLSTRLQNGAMSFRMVPISNLFERFPLQLRDLARTVGKKIRVDIIGGDTELDKVLINRLADPLLHMLRNSIDHGIESPEERLRLGKPESGTITLKTYYHGSFAVIEIRDDGKGLNLDRILAKALEKNLISESQKDKLSNTEIMELIFLPGFSTNEQVTELSGRGVGMDVVKTAISQLHGSVEIDSKAGAGTCFKLKLPLTLAIVKILLVQESSHQFALPILNIEALIIVQRDDIKRIDDRLIFNYHGQTIPVASLSSILNFPQSRFQNERLQMVILNENQRLTGILVDSVLGRQEILIKNLGRFLKKAPFVMGCTILRDSRLVLILDPRQVVEAVKKNGAMELRNIQDTTNGGQAGHTILIVDDSAIQRENLKTIFKSTDYHVETAENGFDAMKACRKKNYSAFCVDVLMPLMDGYEFIERLRRIGMYQKVPIFLITGNVVDRARIANLNITQVLQKPVNGDELVALVNRQLLKKVEA